MNYRYIQLFWLDKLEYEHKYKYKHTIKFSQLHGWIPSVTSTLCWSHSVVGRHFRF
jgi:hypothetical protein